jgi:hypothetical protein
MNSNVPGSEWDVRTLRAWHLAILRFAVTLDNADRLAVLAIATEIDRLGPRQDGEPDFNFFRRTSAELCAAIARPNELTSTLLRQYLARIDDDRLKRTFAAATEAGQPTLPSADKPIKRADKPIKRDNGLWRGLSSRGNHLL